MDGFKTKTRRNAGLVYPHGDRTPEIATTITVAPGIEWVRMPLPFSLKFINLWLIDDGDGYTIVDTGMPLPETKDAWRTLLESRLSPNKPLKRVIVTHMHPDHIGNAGWLTYKYGAELWISRLEYISCRMLVADTGREAPEAGLDFYRKAAWPDDAIENYKKRFGGFGRAVSQMPDRYYRLEDGMTFRMAGKTWEVITGNGHSPEHACLYCPDLNVVISGDQLLPRISSNVSVFPTEPVADPLKDWIQSCEKLLERLPEDVLVLPAHNEPFQGAHPRLRHLIDGHETALRRLKRKLAASDLTVLETFTSLFGRAIKPDEIGMATGEAIAHLNCLIHRGEAEMSIDDDGIAKYRAA